MSGIGFNGSVKVATPDSFHHKLPYTNFTTFDMFQFRPVFLKEMYPTEHFKVGVSDYFRASSMAGAIYGNFRKKYSAFFVPYRVLWNKWNDYLTGGSSGKLTFNIPQLEIDAFLSSAMNTMSLIGTLDPTVEYDQPRYYHLRALYRSMLDMWSDCGFPIRELFGVAAEDNPFRDVSTSDFRVPAFRFLACQRIWFDWYRDQNLIGDDLEDTYCPKSFNGVISVNGDSVVESFGANIASQVLHNTLLAPKPISLFKDYFNTRNLEPQRGNAAFVPVQLPSVSLNPGFDRSSQAIRITSSGVIGQSNGASTPLPDGSTDIIGMFDYNQIRIAKGVQRFLEKNNIAGGADLQQLLAHWGTAPNPSVFQKSTFIGSFDDRLQISEVVSPSDVGDSSAGEVVTRLQAAGNGKFEYTANEHGFFVIVMTVRPENVYNGGFSRSFMHGVLGNGRFDFFTPDLEKTGEQPVYLREQTDAILLNINEDLDFDYTNGQGFVPRYAEGKCVVDHYSGQMQTRKWDPVKISRDFGVYDSLSDAPDAFVSVAQTMVYGYPWSLKFDSIFKDTDTLYDHFDGWIHFDFEKDSPMHSYAAPLIEDVKGDDITLPYAGVRM